MKIFKSIKWRLQIWYGLILVAVLAALGITAYQLERQELFGRIDNELQRRFSVLADVLHGHGHGPGQPPFSHPPPGQMPGDFPPPDHEPREFHLPPQDNALFDPAEIHQFQFEIFGRDGNVITRSTNFGSTVFMSSDNTKLLVNQNLPPDLSPNKPSVAGTFSRKQDQFIVRQLPSGETIWLGCSIAPEIA